MVVVVVVFHGVFVVVVAIPLEIGSVGFNFLYICMDVERFNILIHSP